MREEEGFQVALGALRVNFVGEPTIRMLSVFKEYHLALGETGSTGRTGKAFLPEARHSPAVSTKCVH
jgi:hypothetical protein